MRIDIRHLCFVVALPLGCTSGDHAFQPTLSGISGSAVSWALTTITNQGGAKLNAAHDALLSPPSGEALLTSYDAPTQAPTPLQLVDSTAFVHYTLTILKATGTTNLGEVVSVHTSHGDFVAGLEYWALKQAGLDDIPNATGIQIVGVDGDWDSPPSWPPSGSLPEFTNDVEVSWTSGAPGGSDTVFKYAGTNYVAWVWGLDYDSGWTGSLTWYRTASSQPASTDLVFGPGTFTLYPQTGGGSAPSGQSWYYSDCVPE